MKILLITITMLVLCSNNIAFAKADNNIAKKQLIQGVQKFARSTGVQRRQLNAALHKIRRMSSAALNKAVREMQGKGIRLGENNPNVAGQLADIFKSYSSKSSAQGHMSKTFGNGKTGNGMSNSLQGSMRKQKHGGDRTGQQSGILGDIYDWIFKTPDEAYADKNKAKGVGVYGGVNAPKGCLTTGCPETPNPENDSSSSGNNAYDRKKNQQAIDARLGKFGAKQRQKSTGFDIDPRTGKKVAKKTGPSSLDMYGNPNPMRIDSSGNVSAEALAEAKRKATQERLKQ